MYLRIIVPAILLVVAVLSLHSAATANGTVPINFTRGIVAGSGFSIATPTALAVGPDGRIYVANSSGVLQALTLDPNTKQVTAVQQITGPANICPAGQSTPAGCIQEIYGITFDPTDASSPPPVYITNTVSGFGGQGQAPSTSFPGKITKISGAGYATRTDIITGLPISNSGHEANDLKFGPDGKLYIEQGSSTNAGAVNPSAGLFQLPDTPLSGAVLVADIKAPAFNGAITYNQNAYSSGTDQTGGDVSVYASGLRNPYGLLWHSNGKLYATDNGPNAGYGHASVTCPTDSGVDASGLDELDLITAGKYYGHANRNRGRTDARQCQYHFGVEASTVDYTAPIESNLPASSDGMTEYTSNKFAGQMQGDILYAAWVNSELHRVKLSANGQSVVSDTTLATGLVNALAVGVGADGTIYVAEYGASRITFLKPDETAVSSISVTGVTPAAGPLAGGQTVTITGSNFTTSAETVVTIGGVAATNIVVQNSTTITAVTAAHAAGATNVVVTNSIGTATLTNGYTYSAGGGGLAPIAVAGPDVTTPVSHLNHAHVNLDARASTDPDGGFIVSYDWSENGTSISSLALDTLEFTEGTHLVTLTVTDDEGLTGTDQIRITVTAGPLNTTSKYCFDVDGNHAVNSTDLFLVAAQFGKRFGQPGYTRLKDWDANRIINSTDLFGVAKDYTAQCPLVDQQIRTATAGMEQYQNINAAIAAGYSQVTPFIPGIGRHMIKGGIGGTNDAVFEPDKPESLLYEPDSSTPGGWRLGGAMYIIPITLQPQVPVAPQSFATTDAAWHVHDALCTWNNFNAVQENTVQSDCLSRPGNPVWVAEAGWLLHLWNFVPNVSGRFVENNTKFAGLP